MFREEIIIIASQPQVQKSDRPIVKLNAAKITPVLKIDLTGRKLHDLTLKFQPPGVVATTQDEEKSERTRIEGPGEIETVIEFIALPLIGEGSGIEPNRMEGKTDPVPVDKAQISTNPIGPAMIISGEVIAPGQEQKAVTTTPDGKCD